MARRHQPDRRLHGSQPRLQTPLPALPRRADLRRPLPHRRRRRRPGGRARADRAGRAPHHVRRSGFLQRHRPRPAHRGAAGEREAPGITYDVTIKIEHLLRHADRFAAASRHRVRVRDVGGRVGGRRGAREAREGTHARRLRDARRA